MKNILIAIAMLVLTITPGFARGSHYSGYHSHYSGSHYGSRVHVRGYFRKDGTYVHPYTRRWPHRHY